MEPHQPFQFILLLSGIAFTGAGAILYFFPPRKINYWYGYRTAASMRSKERWDFAQKYSGRALAVLGMALVAGSLLGELLTLSEAGSILLSLGLIIAGAVVVLLRVEKALKVRFGDL